MTREQKYQTYHDMLKEAEELEYRLYQYLTDNDYAIYCIFLAVQDEESQKFFVDVEIGGSPEKYSHITGGYTKAQIEKIFHLNEESKEG